MFESYRSRRDHRDEYVIASNEAMTILVKSDSVGDLTSPPGFIGNCKYSNESTSSESSYPRPLAAMHYITGSGKVALQHTRCVRNGLMDAVPSWRFVNFQRHFLIPTQQ